MAKTTKKTTTRKKASKKITAENVVEEVNKLVEADAEALPETPVDNDNVVTEITLAKFKKLFKEELKETADWLWREDKEKDFPDKATCKEAALRFVIENHPEYTVTDY